MGEITEVFEKINSNLCSDKENYTKTVRTALSAEVCNNMFKHCLLYTSPSPRD